MMASEEQGCREPGMASTAPPHPPSRDWGLPFAPGAQRPRAGLLFERHSVDKSMT